MKKITKTNTCPVGKIKDDYSILGSKPPNIQGFWRQQLLGIRRETPQQKVTPYSLQSAFGTWDICQNNRFTTIDLLNNIEADEVFIGVWQPIILKGEVVDWQLITAADSDNGIFFVSVLKRDQFQTPVQLMLTYTESGFSFQNQIPDQKQTVWSGTLNRIK
ncbi:hypothetical protein IC620_01280 [Hazenella sp. IB182357]|uniref:Uncharacterized protein n=1 Tax=Polycladospora coralii TaxID=2771432 RepID=A0A926RSD7_9BACL|nr:hypothetical protein [Polycladospora coralii]MBD1370995.1 hypothetical protein [Polycladospora coralii]MBS7529934.1 hypothetical protein [Polycladospora coralii]